MKIIKIAHGLYSQYDAHVGGDSKIIDFNIPDCGHYCAQSGIFNFVRRMIFNNILS